MYFQSFKTEGEIQAIDQYFYDYGRYPKKLSNLRSVEFRTKVA